jgi:hypothetical protein
MRAQVAGLSLGLLLGGGVAGALTNASLAKAQASPGPQQPDYSSIYCSGFVTDDKVPQSTYIISGEQPDTKIEFHQGDYVYINKGSDGGVKNGDQFAVVRATADWLPVPWFKWQKKLLHAMGTHYDDIGRVRVTTVQPKVSIAQVVFSCAYMQRDDIALPYEDRPAPPYRESTKADYFAPVNGKPLAMVVVMHGFAQLGGAGSQVYVNLGSAQGVKVGDYFRVFRYQGSHLDTAPQTSDYQDMLYGFGSTPARYSWRDLPRQILGEGIVLNVSRNASTVLLTDSRMDIYAGDYVELE